MSISIFSVVNFTVEMDTKYVKGMINKPDLQPNTTTNEWVMGICVRQLDQAAGVRCQKLKSTDIGLAGSMYRVTNNHT
jgi:hypothetical protein